MCKCKIYPRWKQANTAALSLLCVIFGDGENGLTWQECKRALVESVGPCIYGQV